MSPKAIDFGYSSERVFEQYGGEVAPVLRSEQDRQKTKPIKLRLKEGDDDDGDYVADERKLIITPQIDCVLVQVYDYEHQAEN